MPVHLTSVNTNNHLTRKQVKILGQAVKVVLSSEQLSSSEKEDFYKAVRKYYIAVCNYVIDTFALNDELLLHARIANPGRRLDTKFAPVEYFVKRFNYMEDKLDELEVEFGHFQVDPLDSISLEKRVDAVWVDISSIKDKTTGRDRYVYLPRFMFDVPWSYKHKEWQRAALL